MPEKFRNPDEERYSEHYQALITAFSENDNVFCHTMKEGTFSVKEIVTIKENLQGLFEEKIKWVDSTTIEIDEHGEVWNGLDLESKNNRFLESRSMTIENYKDLKKIESYPYVYIYSVELTHTTSYLISAIKLRYMTCNLRKKKVTFTISEVLDDEFSAYADKMAINKSKFVENRIKELMDCGKN